MSAIYELNFRKLSIYWASRMSAVPVGHLEVVPTSHTQLYSLIRQFVRNSS